MPTSHNLIVWALFTGYAIAHTSAMIRTNAWDVAGRHYHPSLPTSEDLELWLRMLHVTRFANLAEVLVLYRQWPQSQSIGNAQVQRQSSMGTFSKAASDLLEKPVPGELRLHVNILYLRDHLLSEQEASRAIKFLLELYPALHKAKLIDSGALDEVMIERIKTIARHSRPLLLRTVITLARVHTPLWLRRLWVRVRGFST
jgi:hypothetical protein